MYMPKGVKILFVILGVFLVLGVIIYIVFFGVTKKQKYEKCMQTCEEMLLLESSKQYCAPRCEEVTGYQQETQSKSSSVSDTVKSILTPQKSSGITYYCEWSWPQKIINQDTKEVIEFCTPSKPYCNYADKTYDTVACCESVNKQTKEYSNCTYLKDIEH